MNHERTARRTTWSAFAAMSGETDFALRPARRAPDSNATPRIIVFHGTADTTVHPANAERIVAAASCAAPTGASSRSERGAIGKGRGYLRTVTARPDGTASIECWMIESAGHAWSGGHPSGNCTDPGGPDASAEMVRFVLDAPAEACAP